jgi:hypothetical protein
MELMYSRGFRITTLPIPFSVEQHLSDSAHVVLNAAKFRVSSDRSGWFNRNRNPEMEEEVRQEILLMIRDKIDETIKKLEK